jgi:photosystem II stability/assembly factor-like uncharacterized protein
MCRSGRGVRLGVLLSVAFAVVASLAAFAPARAQDEAEGWRGERRGDAGKDLNTIFFVDRKRGWAAGDGGVIVRTEDEGRTWSRQSVGTKDAVNDIYFLDKEDGYLLAGNRIFASTDGGATWRESANFPPATFGGAEPELYSVRFTSKKRGWIVGSVSRRDTVVDSLVLKTTDGGTSWQRLRVPTKSELINLDFSGDKRGWIVGNSGVVLHTRDAGETWALQRSGTTSTLYSVDFRGDRQGWAVGERGTILKTRDGGETWRVVSSAARGTLLGVRFANDEDGWVVGRGGVILRTADEGDTWVLQETGTKRNLFALFVDKDNCWAVGGDGLVLTYKR